MNIINSISKGNLKNNKSKSTLIIISIALTTCLLVSIGILGLKFADGLTKGSIERAGSHHARYRGVNSKDIDILENHISIDDIGVIGNLGTMQDENMNLSIAHIDDSYVKFTNLELLSGNLPEKIGEIALTDAHLESLNLDNNIGYEIDIKYYVGDKFVEGKYKLTGIIKANEKSRAEKMYSGVISNEEYLKEKGEDAKYTAFITIKNTEKDSKKDIEYQVKDIAKNLNIPEEKTIINSDYLNNLKPGLSIKLAQMFAGIIVLMTAIIVIYNIFYFSINSKIKDYGKLRAVGATKKQIKKIIMKEGLFLSLIGIPIGLILGVFLGEVVIGKFIGEKIVIFSLKQVIILIIAGVSTLFAVIISLIKPMRIASNISAVEAMKYSESEAGKTERKTYYEQMDIKKLTDANLQRNKKRTIITSISLSLSAILFVTTSIIMNAFDAKEMAKTHHPNDFSIGLTNYSYGNNLSYNEDEMILYNELQLDNPLNDEFIDKLSNIDGVKRIFKSYNVRMKQISPKMLEEEFSNIKSFRKSDVEELNKYVKEGSFNTDEYIKNNGIAFSSASFNEFYGDIKIGDTVELEIFDGNNIVTKEFTVMAITDSRGSYLLPEEVFNSMFNTNVVSSIGIDVDSKKHDEINNYLDSIAQGDKYLSFTTLKNSIKEMKESVAITNIIGYGLVSIIFIISLMNFINTLISNALSRKKEIGMLRAIGLSDKQLLQMLDKEGLFYIKITLISAIVIGTVAGFIGIQIMKQTGASYARFEIPILMIVFLFALPLIEIICNKLIVKNIKKESIVDLIRYND
ncbi:MAG: ABC transporter permease [Sarcina sp.]